MSAGSSAAAPAAGADTDRATDGARRLFGFEKDEVERIAARFDDSSDTAYQIHNGFGGSVEERTEGHWALRRIIADRYGFLAPGNTSTYYIRHRTGCVLNTYGWFSRAMPTDWSGFDALRVDVRSDTVDVTVLLELEDATMADPLTRQYAVPAGQWVALEVDLAEGRRRLGLDLRSMAGLRLIITEMAKRVPSAAIRVDHLRLVKADAADRLPILRDASPMAVPPRVPGPVKTLDGMDLATAAALPGRPGIVELVRAGQPSRAAYPLLMQKERCLGGFGRAGVLLVSGASAAHLSLDGGLTWRGLDGKVGPSPLISDIRSHRATVLVDGRDIYVAGIPAHCAGGGGRTEMHFTRALYRDGRWSIGPQVVFETGVRHCADRLSLVRLKGGRLWVAWNHLSRNAAYGIHAKYSDDGGATWRAGGRNGLIGEEKGGIPDGPFLAEWGEGVVCVWWQAEVLLWAHSVGEGWTEPMRIRGREVPLSVVAAAGGLFVAVRRPDAVLRYDGRSWIEDSPPIGTGLLTRLGDRVACVGTVKADAGTAIVLSWRRAAGGWDPPQTVAVEPEEVEGLAVPQVCPADSGFVPVAWSSTRRRWIKVLAVPWPDAR